MAMSKQQLDHLLSGRRRPSLDQAIAIYKHTGIEPHRWNERVSNEQKGNR